MRELQQQIIEELGVQPSIKPSEQFENRVGFLVEQLGSTGRRGYVLGISGGQDSLLAGMLAQEAVNRVRDQGGDAQFYAMLLPYGIQADREDALLASSEDVIDPDNVIDFDIKPAVDSFADAFNVATGNLISDFDKGNAKARARMMAQYAVASENGLLVVGTDHAAEAVTGFFTKFGDGAADILPLAGLNKRQGRQILRFLEVPEIFTQKAPTADLLDANPGQADESELGIPYEQIDDYLEGKVIPEEIAQRIEGRFLSTAHKRTEPVAYN